MENKELLDARKSKKLAEALTDKIVKILKYGDEYTVITGEKKSKMQLIVVGKLQNKYLKGVNYE